MRARRVLARLPIRAKLTLAYMSVIGVMLGVIALFLYVHFEAGLDDGINNTLRARSADVSRLLGQEGVRGLTRRRELLAAHGVIEQVLSARGKLLFSSAGDSPLLTRAATQSARPGARFIDQHERTRLLVRPGRDGAVVVVQASLEQREHALELLNGALIVGGALTLIVASLAGYGLAGAVLRPMEAMRSAAAQITEADPHSRLPLPAAEDEVHRLGVTLNDMLTRMEQTRDRERTFVSDASHELRTPLAILKTEVEVALRTDNPPATLRAALRVAGEEADRLSQLAGDLLVVARSDAGRMDLDRRRVSSRELLEDVERRFRMRAGERARPLTVAPTEGQALRVDVSRIEQALSNLVDNALRHGAGPITLRAIAVDGGTELHVLDEGAGLPPEFLPRAFERFSRPQAGRTGRGSGLGLAIVELIAVAHGGAAGIVNRPDRPGADAWLRLPVA